jgi:UDP-N-acetylglucosamine 2-epimerase (non-hydrolysing)
MPEEINRLLTDQISDYLFTTCADADQNLINEGITRSKIFFVGNVMIDTLLGHQRLAEKSQITVNLGLRKEGKIRDYALLTLHRPSNVDERRTLSGLLDVLNEINSEIPVVFPAHPRTLKQIQFFGLGEKIRYIKKVAKQDWESASPPLLTLAPLGYLDFMHLMSHAKLVLTDSGGIQEETTILGIPCLTLRENTERPITVEKGTNVVVGNDPQSILTHARRVLKTGIKQKQAPKYWDGRAAQRVVNILKKHFINPGT